MLFVVARKTVSVRQGESSVWEVASKQMSFLSLSLFVFSEDTELLPDNNASLSQTGIQVQVEREENKPKQVINLTPDTEVESFFNDALFSCVMAKEFRSHRRELILRLCGLMMPSISGPSGVFYSRVVAILRLSLCFSVSSDHTGTDISALGIQHEYTF